MDKADIPSITNMSLAEVEALCASLDEPSYRAKQILSWMYSKGATTFDQMSDLPEYLRKKLSENCRIFRTRINVHTQTGDGTRKFLIILPNGNEIECVLLREGKRITACVSTQVGCAMACRFCASGKSGLERNLTTGEIVEQALHIKEHIHPEERLTHIVFMGIGEPLANYDNVIKAIRIMNANWGLGIGARHITISTVGIISGISRLAQEGIQINLAISLHAPDDIIRSKIIPSNKKASISNILKAAREYFSLTRRDISFEYILIDKINASLHDAESLARLLKGLRCNINLLPLNPIEGCSFRPPSRETIEIFRKTLEKHGLVVTVRKKKGGSIHAACGQLRLQNINFYGKHKKFFVK
ncbi:MAG: 23S rRNA (adenine(2503)-C(2))-methyltransferase RlmN [Candidatus Brocadiaceae baterium WH-1]|nr:MAG: 23S rRNA (adenine(2503)-C(2))-methyltransferase RlmN [Candidatus Jettenia sp. AMX2]